MSKTKDLVLKGDNVINVIKYPKTGGLTVNYDYTLTYGNGETHTMSPKMPSTINISKRHLDARREFDKHIAYSLYMFGMGIASKEFKDLASKDQNAFKAVTDKIEVDEIIFGGSKDEPWIKLKGTLEGIDEKNVPVETSKINYLGNKYPHAINLQDCIEDIKTCVNNYIDGITDHKQLEMFSDVEEVAQEKKAS